MSGGILYSKLMNKNQKQKNYALLALLLALVVLLFAMSIVKMPINL